MISILLCSLKKMNLSIALFLLSSLTGVNAFAFSSVKHQLQPTQTQKQVQFRHRSNSFLQATSPEDDEDEKPFNPYADPNYPDLEFVNYDDPEYVVDQNDEYFSNSFDSTEEEEVEAMREERRLRNDEYQFETYHADFLKAGEKFKGEWTVYRTSTFLTDGQQNDDSGIPSFKKEKQVRKVVSSGKKILLDPPEGGFQNRLDGERIVHEERLAEAHDFEEDDEWEEVISAANDDIVGKPYAPEEMTSFDFRGPAGVMCVGDAWTTAHGVPMHNRDNSDDKYDGPFSELRTEIGLKYKRMRFRVKWDYRVKPDDTEEVPPLHLYSMIVCRESRERWPRYSNGKNVDDSIGEKLFGEPGAQGGLFDPPPVGTDEQASQYMVLDLEGGATVLFPFKIDQHDNSHKGNGWVQSLDWNPGRLRYQADRKMFGGKKLRGLKTLELSEVESEDVDRWRPNDNGLDMRQ
jgi:hypothetical protein